MSPAEKLERYVQWNQLTRHQLIVAHMTLIAATEEATAALKGALRQPHHDSFTGVVAAAIEALMQATQRLNEECPMLETRTGPVCCMRCEKEQQLTRRSRFRRVQLMRSGA